MLQVLNQVSIGCTWFGVRSFKTLIQILFLFIEYATYDIRY